MSDDDGRSSTFWDNEGRKRMERARLGFIGTGRMGGPMAARLLAAGHPVSVFDTKEGATSALVAQGAQPARSIAEVASSAEIVFASLPSPAIVEQAALGEGGLLDGTAMRVFVDLSTTGSRVATTVAGGLAARQVAMLDAPVSGGIAGATNGTLAVMVSGPRRVYDEVEPLLAHLGKRFFIGESPGMAQTMKLVNNLLAACAIAISSEGMVMGAKAGLDPKIMLDVINASSGRNSATQDKFPRSVLPGTFDFGFATGLSYKDVRLCLDEAEALGVPMVVGSAVRQILAITNALCGPDSDFTSMCRIVEQWGGAEVRAKPA
jgi:3-hydroxyisobutyrate dehydrogenase-like beta-hydroxyacid dehydrogenase